MITILFT